MKSAPPKPTLLLAPELFASSGGISRILQLYLKALCEQAVASGSSVRIVALNDAVVDSSQLRRYANSVLANWLVCERSKKRFVRGALAMSRGCGRIVCGHVAQLPVAWAAKKLNRGLRYYLVAHGIEVWRKFSLAERIALKGAERIFCVSEFTRLELLKHCPLPAERLVVVPNALDPFFEIAPGAPLAGCPPVILSVTRLSAGDSYKGVDHLIAAMPAVRAAIPAATLRVVGRGDDLPRLQALAKKSGLLGHGVEFLGYLKDVELAAEIRTCRLFALPSEKEGFGLVFLEAMAQGRPCLGARSGGIPEVIHADSGVLTEYGDVPALAAACLEGLQRPWNETAILDRARQFSYSHFKARLDSLLLS